MMSDEEQNYSMFSSRILVDTIGDVTDDALKASGMKEIIGVLAGRLFNWGQRKSLFPLHLGIKCCALEMAAAGASRFDAERFGVFFRSSPRQCDVLLVNGPISKKFADPITRLWEQMPEPKWCIAMGECAISGGPYFQSYNILEGVDTIIPVDIYIPGCPPRPEALIDGFGKLREKIIRIGAMPSHARIDGTSPIIIGDD
jgi:NADH-quinone oxidoreductase B subunit